jgi:hypothetical protein
MRAFVRIGAAGALVALAIALAGCATPADKTAMTVTASATATGKQYPYSVSVATSGGKGTGAMESSNIDNADLKAAIEASIKETRLFKEVVQGKDGQYELTVNVIELSKPSFGLTFTVDLEAGWTLVRTSDKQVVFRKALKSTGTAGVSDAFAGVVRLRLAVENAAKANIAQGLVAIGELNL